MNKEKEKKIASQLMLWFFITFAMYWPAKNYAEEEENGNKKKIKSKR